MWTKWVARCIDSWHSRLRVTVEGNYYFRALLDDPFMLFLVKSPGSEPGEWAEPKVTLVFVLGDSQDRRGVVQQTDSL